MSAHDDPLRDLWPEDDLKLATGRTYSSNEGWSCCQQLCQTIMQWRGLRASDLDALQRRQKAAEWSNVFSEGGGGEWGSESGALSSAFDSDPLGGMDHTLDFDDVEAFDEPDPGLELMSTPRTFLDPVSETGAEFSPAPLANPAPTVHSPRQSAPQPQPQLPPEPPNGELSSHLAPPPPHPSERPLPPQQV